MVVVVVAAVVVVVVIGVGGEMVEVRFVLTRMMMGMG